MFNQFRYNIQMCLHAKQTGHEVHYTATDEYQRRITCSICGCLFRTLVSLQRHQLTTHKKTNDEVSNPKSESETAPYFCSFCSQNFKTSTEAIIHRRSLAHKEVVRATKSDKPSMSKNCPNCQEVLPNLLEYKTHLLEVHPELCHRFVKYNKYNYFIL